MSQYKHLFEPLKIGPIEVKNRIMCLAMGTGMRINHGEFSDDLIAFYATRVSGGAGLGMVPMTPMYPGPSLDNIFQGAYEERLLPGMKKMADDLKVPGYEEGFKQNLKRFFKGKGKK